MSDFSFTGFGIGLRPVHYQSVLDHAPDVDWFEIVSEDYLVDGGATLDYLDKIRENYPLAMHGVSLSLGSCDPLDLVDGGATLDYLDKIRENYPLAMHGVSLSLGSCDPLDANYLERLKNLAHRIDPLWVSDHLCWTGVNGVNIHDLMPLPYTPEAIDHVVNRIQVVQDVLGSPILIENVSSYVEYRESVMPEWEFLKRVAEKSGCFILLDLNNIFVNAYNHGFAPEDYLDAIPEERVVQFHIAGHDHCGTHVVDTHDHPVVDSVWDLYKKAVKRFGRAATLIERDANIPPLEEMLKELNVARSLHESLTCELVP